MRPPLPMLLGDDCADACERNDRLRAQQRILEQ
jgi:hypothetical protein